METIFSSAPPNCGLDQGCLTLRPLFPVHHRLPFGPCQPTLHKPFPAPVDISNVLSLRMYLCIRFFYLIINSFPLVILGHFCSGCVNTQKMAMIQKVLVFKKSLLLPVVKHDCYWKFMGNIKTQNSSSGYTIEL